MVTVANPRIAQAQGVYREEFGLFVRGDGGKRMRGFLRARSHQDEETGEIYSRTCEIAWERGLTYDPRLDLVGYFLNWAKYMVARHYRELGRRRRHARILSEFGDAPETALSEEDFEDDSGLGRPDLVVPDELDAPERLKTLERVFEITFNADHPPHQLIALGFLKVLGLKPRELVAQHSQDTLNELADELERRYLEVSGLPPGRVKANFSKLRANLELPLGELVTHHKQRAAFEGKLDRITGQMALWELYGAESADAEDRAKDVVRWRYAAEQRACRELKNAGIEA